jgi:hypothetical protein
MHPHTRQSIHAMINKNKENLDTGIISHDDSIVEGDEEDYFYFCIMMLDETVVTIFKNNKNIRVTPADINVILNFMKTNQVALRCMQPCFEEICLPGMTEEYKLPVFFKYNEAK